MKYAIFLCTITTLLSCSPSVNENESNGETYEFEISDIEITSREKEARKDSLILKNVNELLNKRESSLIKNYWFLCDTVNINPIRDGFSVEHKDENINIHLGKETVTVRPIPGSYEIKKGPYAKYKLLDDSLGEFHSYVIDIQLNEDFKIKDYYATVRFHKIVDGVDKITFTEIINKNDHYLLSEKFTDKKWR